MGQVTNTMLLTKMEAIESDVQEIKNELNGNGQPGLVKEFEQTKTKLREHFINHSKGGNNYRWAITTGVALFAALIALGAFLVAFFHLIIVFKGG